MLEHGRTALSLGGDIEGRIRRRTAGPASYAAIVATTTAERKRRSPQQKALSSHVGRASPRRSPLDSERADQQRPVVVSRRRSGVVEALGYCKPDRRILVTRIPPSAGAARAHKEDETKIQARHPKSIAAAQWSPQSPFPPNAAQ